MERVKRKSLFLREKRLEDKCMCKDKSMCKDGTESRNAS